MSKRSRSFTVKDKGHSKAKRLTLDTRQFVKKSDLERKYYEQNNLYTLTAGGIATSWVGTSAMIAGVDSMFVPVLGNDTMNRIGRQVEVRSIKIRGGIDIPIDVVAAQGVSPFVRVVLAVQIAANGTVPLPATLFSANGPYAFMDRDTFGEWRVLKDMNIEIPSLSTTSNALGTFNTEGIQVPFKINHKFKTPLKVLFSNLTAGNSGDVSKNNICLFAMASSITYNPRLVWKSSIVFNDA